MTSDGGERYREFVRCSPGPSLEQSCRFAEFLSDDHSWYKHLPFEPPGEPFFVYLAPHTHEVPVERRDGGVAYRPIVRRPSDHRFGFEWDVDFEKGDLEVDDLSTLNYYSRGRSTAEWRENYDRWTYWNHGPAGQPRDDAIARATASVTVIDDTGGRVAVPAAVLELGLVYLRATVSPFMGRWEADYEELRSVRTDLPPPVEDRQAQLAELVVAMDRVASWVYD